MLSSTYSLARRIASLSMSIADNTACSASSEYGGRRSEYGSRPWGAIEYSTGELDIFPCWAFPCGIPKQCRRVIRDDERDAAILMDRSPQFSDRRFGVEKSLGGEAPERNDYFRLDQLELPDEVWSARRDLVRQRVAVAGRPVLEHVADEDVFAPQLHRRENFVEQIPCGPNERPPGFVLGATRGLANADELCFRVTLARHGVESSLVKAAAGAFRH